MTMMITKSRESRRLLIGEEVFFRGEHPDTRTTEEWLIALGFKKSKKQKPVDMKDCSKCGTPFIVTRCNRETCSNECSKARKRRAYNRWMEKKSKQK
jgi:hypothetical protein